MIDMKTLVREVIKSNIKKHLLWIVPYLVSIPILWHFGSKSQYAPFMMLYIWFPVLISTVLIDHVMSAELVKETHYKPVETASSYTIYASVKIRGRWYQIVEYIDHIELQSSFLGSPWMSQVRYDRKPESYGAALLLLTELMNRHDRMEKAS